MLIQHITRKANGLAHGKRRRNGADAQALQMVEETQRQACRHCQTDDIEANFDFGVRNARNIGQLPGKQVRGDDGQLAAVGERNA